MTAHFVVVTHSHLDREWYRTAEALRARLVDAVDDVLDLVASDPDFVFTLDGQTVVLEDYLELRPYRRAEVLAATKSGRLSFGPWYVQPDGFIPAGESIVRNLLEGRAVGAEFGAMSRVGYLPDTFGHPAALPLVLRGFDLDAFCFRRGRDDEAATLPTEFVWEAPDGTSILALFLAKGYSNAAWLPADVDEAAQALTAMGLELLSLSTGDTVVFMNGCDHTLPTDMRPVLSRLAEVSGAQVVRGTVDDVVSDYLDRLPSLRVHRGELRGSVGEALLHGVLSTRTYLKLANARCESALLDLAEPFAALASLVGARDERPGLRAARRELLLNHAHDSLCGTSIDPVHREMEVRFHRVEELATGTAERAMGVLAGTGAARPGQWDGGADLAVFNPHPHPVSGRVELWFDADPPYAVGDDPRLTNPPLIRATLEAPGLAVDGKPARKLTRPNDRQFVWFEEVPDCGVEFVVEDVPAYGWKKVRLTASDAAVDVVDDGRVIGDDVLSVEAADDGTVSVIADGRRWDGLLGLVDEGDRGDSYDLSPVQPFVTAARVVSLQRVRHASGIERLVVHRELTVPVGLRDGDKSARSEQTTTVDVTTTCTVVPGVPRVDVDLEVTNRAGNHRLRLVFPLADQADQSLSGGPFDVVTRPVKTSDGVGWVGVPPKTFPAHGFATVPGSGLAVSAPGLLETEVTESGELLVTVLRAMNLLSDVLPNRGPAGPVMRIPDGQCLRTIRTRLALIPYGEAELLPGMAREAVVPLKAVEAGDEPAWPAGVPLLEAGPDPVVVSSIKPAESGDGVVIRLWNPGATSTTAWLRLGPDVGEVVSVRLDEQPDGLPLDVAGGRVLVPISARGVRTVVVDPAHPEGKESR